MKFFYTKTHEKHIWEVWPSGLRRQLQVVCEVTSQVCWSRKRREFESRRFHILFFWWPYDVIYCPSGTMSYAFLKYHLQIKELDLVSSKILTKHLSEQPMAMAFVWPSSRGPAPDPPAWLASLGPFLGMSKIYHNFTPFGPLMGGQPPRPPVARFARAFVSCTTEGRRPVVQDLS